MIRITLKGVRGHLVRFLLTVISVTLGTALIAGTFILTDSMNKTFDNIFDATSSMVDVSVRGTVIGESDPTSGQTLREQLPITLADTLREVPGAQRVIPDLEGQVTLVGADGTAVRNGVAATLGFGIASDDPDLTIVSGRFPNGLHEVAVESRTLELSGLAVGDHTQALIVGEPTAVTIVAEVAFDGPTGGATLVFIDEETGQAVFAPEGKVQSFSVTAVDGVSQEQLRDELAPLLPAEAEAVTGEEANEESKESLRKAIGFINTFLLVFAVISVFVGAFIIFNTFSMLVFQRTRELALLRAIGAARGQVLRVVLGEAFFVGLAGGLAGLAVGAGLARLLQMGFEKSGMEISGGLPILPRTVVWTLSVGVVVTLLSAVLPAWRASRISPMVALREDLVRSAKGGRVIGMAGVVMIAAGAVLVIVTSRSEDTDWVRFSYRTFLLLIGTLLAAPVLARPLVRIVTWPFVLTFGVVGRLARENGLRVPRRTAITASALLIGVTLMTGVAVIAQSTKASVSDIVEKQVTADFVLDSGQQPFPTTVAEKADELPDVRSAVGFAGASVETGSSTLPAVAADAAGIRANMEVELTSGNLESMDTGEVLVDEQMAKDNSWEVGSTFITTIGVLSGRSLTVGGITRADGVFDGMMVIPRELYTEAVPPAMQSDVQVFVKMAPGADPEKVRDELTAMVKPYLIVSVLDAEEFVDDQASQVDTLLAILYVLLALSVIIAVLGIVNTLALSVFERTREIGLLRAVGLTRWQLSQMITIESVAIAVLGALLGTGLGIVLGIDLQRNLVSSGMKTLAIPWVLLTSLLVSSMIAGVVAATLPSIRAVRLDVLKAISTE